MTRRDEVIAVDLLSILQTVRDETTVHYRGHAVVIRKADDRPPLLYVTVSGWQYALSVQGQDTNRALAAIREIDQLIDLIDDIVNYPEERN